MEKFIQTRLKELRFPQETRNLIGELSSRIMDHRGRVHELLHSEPLRHPEVAPLILVGLAADRPLESNFFPGSWRDYWGALALLPPGRVILPHLPVRALAAPGPQLCRKQSHELSRRMLRHQKLWGCLPTWTFVTRRVSLKKQRHLIPPVFLDPLFIPKMAKAVFKVVKPPVVSKVLPFASNREASFTPDQPEGDGPEQGVLKSEEPTPSTSQLSPQVQEQISEASNTDSDKADKPTPEEEPPHRSLKVRLPLKLLKRGHQTMASSSKNGVTPSKVWKEMEAQVSTLTRPLEATLQKARFELYQKDLPEVQEVRARILGLEQGEEITQQALDSSPTFHLRQAADKTHPPTVIGAHWIDHLDTEGCIANCKPHDFKFEDEWLPLYTRSGVTRHVSGLSSLLKTQGDSPLIAVIPPGMLFQSE